MQLVHGDAACRADNLNHGVPKLDHADVFRLPGHISSIRPELIPPFPVDRDIPAEAVRVAGVGRAIKDAEHEACPLPVHLVEFEGGRQEGCWPIGDPSPDKIVSHDLRAIGPTSF